MQGKTEKSCQLQFLYILKYCNAKVAKRYRISAW